MSESLDWLRQVIEARTPGPWRWRSFGGEECLVADHGRRDMILVDARTRIENGRLVPAGGKHGNMEFIATVGTLADKMLAVIEAAEIFQRGVAPIEFKMLGEETLIRIGCLKKELAALRAAKPGGLE